VNNEGVRTSRAEQNSNSPNKLLEQSNEMDARTPGNSVGSDPPLATVAKIDRSKNN
jgi:hypothetical protein